MPTKLNRCRFCGCTDATPCRRERSDQPAFCSWVNKRHTVCSFCAADPHNNYPHQRPDRPAA